jgi:hypothetical protein
MKKIVALLAVVLLLSCNKDDDDGSVPITYQNLMGKWNIKSVVKADGTVVPYVGRCASQKDYIDMYASGDVAEKYFMEDCATLYTAFIEFTFDQNYEINTASTSFLYEGAIIKNMTNTSFTIEFPEPRTANFEYFYVTNSKAILFERR